MRTIALDAATRSQMNGEKIQVNASWNGATSFTTRRGADRAMFLGYNSPIIIDRIVARVMAVTAATTSAAEGESPHEIRTGDSSAETAGSMVHPVRSVVRVIPNWAAERWVEVRARAVIAGVKPDSPALRRASRSLRSRVTSANSDATKNPVPIVRRTPNPTINHSVISTIPQTGGEMTTVYDDRPLLKYRSHATAVVGYTTQRRDG